MAVTASGRRRPGTKIGARARLVEAGMAEPTRPNVVLIVSDDHGYADLGYRAGAPDAVTPALDALAADAVDCTNAYVTAPICSPSRAGLIAGRYQRRWGVEWFGNSAFPDDYPSLAERFSELGYATGYLGKVHYGAEQAGDRACPPHHGFAETFYGLAGQQMGRLNYLHHTRAAAERYGPQASWRMAVQPMLEGDEPVEFDGFLTEELGRRACEFVTRHEGEPFFLQLCFNAVHNFCWQLPASELAARGLPAFSDWHDGSAQDYRDWYDGVIAPNLPDGRAYYLAQLELMDRQIGLLDQQLAQLGLRDDTIVVYLTDNGGSTCNFADNYPLRGTKYTLWEGGIRVPYLVRWPAGGIDGGRSCDALVSSMDLYPSLLAAVGADASAYAECDGLDQLETWRSCAGPGHEALFWDVGFSWAVRSGNWKLMYTDHASPVARGVEEVEHVRLDRERPLRLTNLADDPREQRHDREHVDERIKLEGLRARWLADVTGAAASDQVRA